MGCLWISSDQSKYFWVQKSYMHPPSLVGSNMLELCSYSNPLPLPSSVNGFGNLLSVISALNVCCKPQNNF